MRPICRRILTACSIFTALVSTSGCQLLETCNVGQNRCEGNTLYYCQPNDPGYSWSEAAPCAGFCVDDGGGNASCVTTPTKIDACAQDGVQCWNNQSISCSGGTATLIETCGGTATCTLTPSCGQGAICALGPADAACDPTSASGTTCFEQDVAACACGYPVSVTESCSDSTANELCVIADNVPSCQVAVPDSRCPYAATSAFCDGDTLDECQAGYVVRITTCPAGTSCQVDNGNVVCA